MKIGIISDTHGLLRPEVIKALEGADAILHGGDIDRRSVLEELLKIAPVYAVRGNADKDWAGDIPYVLDFELCGMKVCMAHKKKDLPKDLSSCDLAVYGHSHKYEAAEKDGILFINPGSCGPRRFRQPITMAVLTLEKGKMEVTRIDIPHAQKKEEDLSGRDLKRDIVRIMKEIEKGRTVEETEERLSLDRDFTDRIFRLYLTHPGVTSDQIMTKLGL